ncbi:MAG: hypothetical protein LBD27_06095, partial [Tannerella sp.]|nr:hypothetical protein [Tannerella sp.]
YELDLAWDNGTLTKSVLQSKYDRTCRLRTQTPVKVFADGKEIPVKSIEGNLIEFESKAGGNYLITTR